MVLKSAKHTFMEIVSTGILTIKMAIEMSILFKTQPGGDERNGGALSTYFRM